LVPINVTTEAEFQLFAQLEVIEYAPPVVSVSCLVLIKLTTEAEFQLFAQLEVIG
jgi:hypothetical protein